MKYKNTKTGAIIDSPYPVSGENWEPVLYNQDGKVVSAEEVPTQPEYVEEEIDLEEMTNKELDEFAKEHKVKLTSDDKRNKSSRISAIAKAFE